MGTRHKRRNFFIKKELQGKLILGYFLFVTGGCLLFIVLLGLFSADTLTISYANHDLRLGQTPFMLVSAILKANWLLIVVGGLFLVLAAMLLTHRIAGPLFRLERALDNMRGGNLGDVIRLREKDEGKELAEKINRFNEDLSVSLRVVRANSQALSALIEQVNSLDLAPEQKDELASLCWSMQEHNRKIMNSCEKYTLRDV